MTQVQSAAANMNAVSGGNGAGDAVSLWRLYALRALYALLAVGEGSIQLPEFLHHAHWTVTSGAAHSFLLALALLSIVGIRYPLGMLPLLIYELLWKMIWLCGYATALHRDECVFRKRLCKPVTKTTNRALCCVIVPFKRAACPAN